MPTLTLQERQEREAEVRRMLDEGLTVNEMARKLGVSQQSMSKFLKRRGWETQKAVAEKVAEERKAKRKGMAKEVIDRSAVVSHKG